MGYVLISAAFAMLATGTASKAALIQPADPAWCTSENTTSDQRISGCSAVITIGSGTAGVYRDVRASRTP